MSGMIRFSQILAFCLITLACTAQEWELGPVQHLNTSGDEFPVFILGEELIYCSFPEKDLLHEEDWGIPQTPVFRSYNMENESVTGFVNLPEGTHGFLQQQDSSRIYLRFSSRSGTEIRLQNKEGTEALFLTEMSVFHLSATDAPNHFIISYRDKGRDDLDLAVMQLESEEVNILPLTALNTSANEFFPSWYSGDLYYSSDSNGNLDLYHATGESQWTSSSALTAFNSDADEHSMVFLTDDKGYFASSNVRGFGGDDILFFQKSEDNSIEDITARLSISGTGLRKIPIQIYDNAGNLIHETISDENGEFLIPALSEGEDYQILPDADARLLRNATLSLEKDGQLLQRILSSGGQGFIFEFLPYRDGAPLEHMDNPDLTSLLGTNISGQLLVADEALDDKGQAVFLLDPLGDAKEVTYTEEEGRFNFEKIVPLASYEIGVSMENIGSILKVDDRELVVDSTASVEYTRLEEGQYISLFLDDGSIIEIEPGEVLRLKKIKYEFDNAELSSMAKTILDDLYALYRENKGIRIELISHTDSRGTDQYNFELSAKRAKNAVNYLKMLGIPEKSVFGTGLGESKLLNACNDGVECTEEEHAVNRRTEVVIHKQ